MGDYRYFMIAAYNGTDFVGWQVQPKGRTVQGTLELALSTILRERVGVVGAGRTDSGVHARAMVAHIRLSHPIECDLNTLLHRLNSFLPWDIVVRKIVEMPSGAHARFDAISRTYRYYIGMKRDPFRHSTETYIPYALNFEAMNAAAMTLVGTRDFTTFSKAHTDVRTHICSVNRAGWFELGDDRYCFEITADRFLRNMVRSIVGQLLLVGRGKMSEERFGEILRLKDRQLATITAQAEGLYLEEVRYREELDEILKEVK